MTSYVAGVMVTANFIGFSGLSKHLVIESIPLERTIRYLASYTFTLYLLHQPLLNFFAAVLHHNPRSVLDQVLLFLLTLIAVLVIGNLTEHKKTAWRKLFEKPVKRLFPVEPGGSG